MFDFQNIEAKWRKRWKETGLFDTPDKPNRKFYLLEMFAYPSGDLHIGHFLNYSIGDVIWRKLKMDGYDILHPFGWDAFGLPAEEAAIKHNKKPGEWTLGNIATARDTLGKIGTSYDWDRELATCLPDYYRWTQWVFLRLHERGLVYRDSSLVNWCPHCKTVLANEQVIDGKCWRCHSDVVKKEMEQWRFRITAYAQRLLDDLDKLEGKWTHSVVAMQRNWIGRSEGARIVFKIAETGDELPIFTTRPDTTYGVTFMSIAPEHKLVRKLLPTMPNRDAVEKYIMQALKRSEVERVFADREKDGVDTGLTVINPLSGDKVPLYVADYVLASYGTGTVMAVPAHDQRDFEFAKKYNIPIKVVIQPLDRELAPDTMTEAYTEQGIMVHSAQFDGTPSEEGIHKVAEYAEEIGVGGPEVSFKLRDWLISRQRYWGAPIPMIHCPKCGTVPVPDSDLPVMLPDEGKVDFIPKGRSPLEDIPEFIETKCPVCGGPARRDPDTMDTFVDSSWYYLRYTDPHNNKMPFSKEAAKKWLPIDLYIGGAEHATGHLLYFRFIHKVLYDMGYIPEEVGDEPALRLFNQGMVMDSQGRVMSKSLGNVISPTKLVERVGVDAARMALFASSPPDRDMLWSENDVKGVQRFIARVWSLFGETALAPEKTIERAGELDNHDQQIWQSLNHSLKRINEDIDRLQFNTCIAAMMEFLHDVTPARLGNSRISFTIADIFIRALAPFAPFIAEELNEHLGFTESVFTRPFPHYDSDAVTEKRETIAVQVNGKLRGTIELPKGCAEAEAVAAAMTLPAAARHTDGKTVVKTIYVPGKVLNIIVR